MTRAASSAQHRAGALLAIVGDVAGILGGDGGTPVAGVVATTGRTVLGVDRDGGVRRDARRAVEIRALSGSSGDVAERLRRWRSGVEGAPPDAQAVALVPLEPEAGAWFGLGPPATALAVRCWAGIAVGPPLAPDGGAPSAVLRAAGELAAAWASGSIDVAQVRADLDATQDALLREGEEAQRQAMIMARDGDDMGSLVRRAVAVAHCGRLVEETLRTLCAGGRVEGPLL